MNNNGRGARYSVVSEWLHWIVAGLILSQFVLAELAEKADDAGLKLKELAILANHKSVGITILALAIVRLGWRFVVRPPALPAAMPRWQTLASHLSHAFMYLLLFAIPVTGWLMSSALAYSVSWFNLIALPDLVEPGKQLARTMHDVHEALAKLLAVVVAVHVAAALKHHFLDKDNVLKRMVSPVGILLFVLAAAGTVLWLGAGSRSAPAAESPSSSLDPAPAVQTGSVSTGATLARAASELPVWNVVRDDSFIEFTAEQAGAPFTGHWTDWSAEIRFSATDVEQSVLDVSIRTGSVSTQDDERDETLREKEWFWTAEYPTAVFRTTAIRESGSGDYIGDAVLTIKGVDTPVEFRFEVDESDGSRTLAGAARLDRIELGVGTGEWADTTWVGQFVDVKVRVTAAAAAPSGPEAG